MNTMIQFFLQQQQNANLLRILREFSFRKKGFLFWNKKKYVDFSSNDYLGFADNKYIQKKSIQVIKKFGNSASASRLLSGDFSYHHLLEQKIAKLKEKQASLLFGSGFLANVGVLPSLTTNKDIIFADKYIHASLIDGLRLSRAKFFRFNHNDMDHLNFLLKKYRTDYDKAYLVTESVFSMDGDKADLFSLIRLKKTYNCILYVDEAHGTGVFGQNGGGYINELGVSDNVDIIMGTLGKALGSYGAYVAGTKELMSFLVNKSRPFIYSTALPPSVVGSALASIELLHKESYRRKKVLSLSAYFREQLQKIGLTVIGDTQIVPIVIGDVKTTLYLSEKLLDFGFLVLPIRPPTVPENTARLRFSVTYYHRKKQIDNVVAILKKNL